MKRYLLFLMALIPVALWLVSCDVTSTKQEGVAGFSKMVCDESFRNIIDEEIEVFEYLYPQSTVMSYYQSESAAFDSLMNGDVDLIVSYRPLSDEQRDYLKASGRAYRCLEIAVDGIAIIVNKENDIPELSTNDLKEIFTGQVSRWGDVYPTKLKNDSIKVVFDANGSGTLHYIQDTFNDGKQLPIHYYAQGSSQAVFDAVEKNKNVIGVIGVSWIRADMKAEEQPLNERVDSLQNGGTMTSAIEFTDRIKVMPIRSMDRVSGCKPYQLYLHDGSYPLVRKIYAIDASSLGTPEHNFFVFITGSIGQKIILQTGVLPFREPLRVVELQ